MKHIKSLIVIVFVAFFATAPSALAFCQSFWPASRIFTPEDNMHAFVHFEDNIQQMVVQPAFQGNVEDFGLVVAVPNRPVITEAPEFIFDDLENTTNPFQPIALASFADDVMVEKSSGSSVVVVEQKNVGDYETSTLQANSSNDLIDWLEDNDYSYTNDNEESFNYYIDEGGYYFIALKVNTSEVQTSDDGMLWGQLRPLEISFSTTEAILPIRIMHGESGQVSLTLYTLGNEMLYIPGVNTLYSKQINSQTLPEIAIDCFTTPCPQPNQWAREYDARSNKWLVRQNVQLNPGNITKDLILSESSTGFIVEPHGGMKTINANLFDTTTGITKGDAPAWKATKSTYANLTNGTRLLKWGSRGDDVRELQMFLNEAVGANLVTDGIWGAKTHNGVTKFQSEFNLKQDGIVGPNTRKFVKLFN